MYVQRFVVYILQYILLFFFCAFTPFSAISSLLIFAASYCTCHQLGQWSSFFAPLGWRVNPDIFSQGINEGCRRVRLKEFFHDEKDQTSMPPKFYKPTGFNPPTGRSDALDEFCSSVKNTANVTPSDKYIKSNLNLPMHKALQQLRKLVFHRIIRISRADKGVAVVIQNVEDYIGEEERQLNNPLHYSKLK